MSVHTPYLQNILEHLESAIQVKDIEVPILPDVTNRVLSLTQDSDSDASQLAKIIQSDPTLGGHVIRIANSAAYTPNSNLVSLQQAITRLGMIEISNIAISTSLNSKIFHAPGYEKQITAIWQHSLVTAVWSKEIARKLRTNVEAAFLCGLLHSIGKPVILQLVADIANNVCGEPTVLNNDELTIIFKRYESSVAEVVAEEWGLPEIVAEAIIYYQHFSQAPSSADVAATTLFGSQFAEHMLNPDLFTRDMLGESPALELVNLYPDEVDELLDKTDVIKSSVQALSL